MPPQTDHDAIIRDLDILTAQGWRIEARLGRGLNGDSKWAVKIVKGAIRIEAYENTLSGAWSRIIATTRLYRIGVKEAGPDAESAAEETDHIGRKIPS